ncbi:MAG: prolyl oligopeptidase family serine peptidase [Oscillospiraceae bacterium]|nr:prolyl oligopeptidase family serine peptidase [Oscillospiraceae bacterium]
MPHFEERSFRDIKYIIHYPEDYKEGEKRPVILFLHGAGTRGDDLDVLKGNTFFNITAGHENFPFITVAPLCPADNIWFDLFEQLKAFALFIADESFTDKTHYFCMGYSMGGYGTWQMGMSLPETFAAIVPICGGGMYWNAGRLKGVPVWAFHGALDTTVFPEESQKMVDAVNKNGGSAVLTIFPEDGHDSWSNTYRSAELFQWMLTCENRLMQAENIYTSPELY